MRESVEQILQKMSLNEKIELLSGKNNWETRDFPQYGIPSLFLADGPCGLRKQTGKGDHLGIEDSVPATAAVSGACLAATWNPECARKNGEILGSEAAAEQVDVLLAPSMNIVRSPLCGRNYEYFSEDPCLTGEIAKAYTEGVQSQGVGACPKHFAGYNQETEREYIDARIDERTLREIYLPAFEKVVKEAKPQAVMSALNQINGTYGAEHKQLLTDILRKEWGFEGFTVSDWYGIVHQDRAVAAGMDLEMPASGGVGAERILRALEDGSLREEDIDRCCRRLLHAAGACAGRKAQNRLQKDQKELFAENHRKSREIAEEGMVLLKNEQGMLPLAPEEDVVLIGLYAKEPKVTLEGSVRVVATEVEEPLACIGERARGAVRWAQGYSEDSPQDDAELFGEAVKLAKEGGKILYFMGQTPGNEMEGHDRKNLSLPEKQEKLLEKILQVNPNVAVILTTPSPVAMPWLGRVKAVFECFLAGQAFGSALAALLYGEANPSGKLPVSFPARLEDTSAYLFFPGDKKTVVYGEGVFVGYRYYDLKRTPLLFPFGHGMSYTAYTYTDLILERKTFAAQEEALTLSVKIRNDGARAGKETVQLYIGMFDERVRRPVRELKHFRKVFLESGQQQEITFSLSKRDFAFYDTELETWRVPEGAYTVQIGASCADIRLQEEVYVEPDRPYRKPLSG